MDHETKKRLKDISNSILGILPDSKPLPPVKTTLDPKVNPKEAVQDTDKNLDHTANLIRKNLKFLHSSDEEDEKSPPWNIPCDSSSLSSLEGYGRFRHPAGAPISTSDVLPTQPPASLVSTNQDDHDDLMASAPNYETSQSFRQDFPTRKQRLTYKRNKATYHNTIHKW